MHGTGIKIKGTDVSEDLSASLFVAVLLIRKCRVCFPIRKRAVVAEGFRLMYLAHAWRKHLCGTAT